MVLATHEKEYIKERTPGSVTVMRRNVFEHRDTCGLTKVLFARFEKPLLFDPDGWVDRDCRMFEKEGYIKL